VDYDEEEEEDDNMEYNSDNDEDNDLGRHDGERDRERSKKTEVGGKSNGNNGEDEEDEEDEVDDSDNNRSPSVRDSYEFGLEGSPSKEESADSDAVRDSFCDSANDSGADTGGYDNGDSVGEETKGTRNKRKERFEQDDFEEDVECEAPVYYFDDVFFNVCSMSNHGEADEQDVLIIGHHPIQTYLDIRDKDFFNVTNGDDSGVHIARAMSHLEDSIHHPLSETVEEFYSGGIGIDTEYF